MTGAINWSQRPYELRAQARELAQRVLDGDDSKGLTALGKAYLESAKQNKGVIPCGE